MPNCYASELDGRVQARTKRRLIFQLVEFLMWSDSDDDKVPDGLIKAAEVKDNTIQWLSKALVKMFSKDVNGCFGQVKDTPVKDMPVKETPVKYTPVKDTPEVEKPYDMKELCHTKKPREKDVIRKTVKLQIGLDVMEPYVPEEEKQNPDFIPTIMTKSTKYWEFTKKIRLDDTPENRRIWKKFKESVSHIKPSSLELGNESPGPAPIEFYQKFPDELSPYKFGDLAEISQAACGRPRKGWTSRLIATKDVEKVKISGLKITGNFVCNNM